VQTLRRTPLAEAAMSIGVLGAGAAALASLVALLHSGDAVGQSRPTRPTPRGDGGAIPAACNAIRVADDAGHFIAREDFTPPVPVVDGDDLLALVNRSPRWVLATTYAPRDLVELTTMRPAAATSCTPPERQCLRREAALAYQRMASTMRREGHEPKLDSAFRGFVTQCTVFAKWAWRRGTAMGFCPATNASAIPGHSQHQLGTAIDLFTLSWTRAGSHFRDGFGCSPGGRWLAQNSWRFGFVLPYPLHPDYRAPGSDCAARPEHRGRVDPRTGYKHEPWHLRYIGVESAERFHRAWEESGPGSATEITLEQWLRERLGARDPVELPSCDGCACGECATFSDGASGRTPCPSGRSLMLDRSGHPAAARGIPTLLATRVVRDGSAVIAYARVRVPEQTLTQPPMGDAQGLVRYGAGVTVRALSTAEGALAREYRAIDGVWRVGVELRDDRTNRGYPWRAALAAAGRDTTANGFNSRLLATSGEIEVGVRIEGLRAGQRVRIAVLRGEEAVDSNDVRLP
jgi:LAS superfamily LD-carboxypeptidase LdcB